MMKRNLYLLLCMLLGAFVTTILHGSIENLWIHLLLNDFETWSLGLTWKQLFILYEVLTVAFVFLGMAGGWYVGKRWWHTVYTERK